ncbi:MAG: phosphonopyruvate decarboxylase, partial [Candidatus Delongbacteria bacterium]|nr:phosphonopyruvate decarboxylase [Candidatus Delongbacteria bacterium]
MEVSHLFESFKRSNVEFYTGVPDSLLKNFCAYITDNVKSKDHIIAANEGAAIGLATGYHLATGKIPLVYLQNSGLGNTINPLLSLADKNVYSVPMVLMIGWRGEPGSKDEPQHMTQGRVQNDLLEAIDMPYYILDKNTDDVESFVNELVSKAKSSSAPVAVVVKAGTFASYELTNNNDNNLQITREQAISSIVDCSKSDEIFVSTTGKTSRELFEIRVSNKQDHQNDFLTVGS